MITIPEEPTFSRYSVEYEFRHQLQTQSFGCPTKFTVRVDTSSSQECINSQREPPVEDIDELSPGPKRQLTEQEQSIQKYTQRTKLNNLSANERQLKLRPQASEEIVD